MRVPSVDNIFSFLFLFCLHYTHGSLDDESTTVDHQTSHSLVFDGISLFSFLAFQRILVGPRYPGSFLHRSYLGHSRSFFGRQYSHRYLFLSQPYRYNNDKPRTRS